MDTKMLDEFFDTVPAKVSVPGTDCVVYQEHKEIYRHTWGYENIEKKTPVKKDSLYFLYSASKVITCAAVLQLLEKGLFLLTDNLYDYLPEFKYMYVNKCIGNTNRVIVPAKNPIRIVDLFTMSSGLSYDFSLPSIKQFIDNPKSNATTREVIRELAKEPLNFEPGEHFMYGMSHDVLAAFAEVVSGKRFSDYVKENIFDVLGMKNSTYELNDDIKDRIATQYSYDPNTKEVKEVEKTLRFKFTNSYDSGGAGIISCVDDYILFADAMANGGVGKNGGRILSEATINLMRQNQLNDVQLNDLSYFGAGLDGYGYGLGVRTMIDPAKGGSLSPVGEFGWNGAKGAHVIIDPENKLSVYYAEHMGGVSSYLQPRIRNAVYAALGR